MRNSIYLPDRKVDNSLERMVALLPVMKMSQESDACKLRRVCSNLVISCTSSMKR